MPCNNDGNELFLGDVLSSFPHQCVGCFVAKSHCFLAGSVEFVEFLTLQVLVPLLKSLLYWCQPVLAPVHGKFKCFVEQDVSRRSRAGRSTWLRQPAKHGRCGERDLSDAV